MVKALTTVDGEIDTVFTTNGVGGIDASEARAWFHDALAALRVGGGMKSVADGATDLAVDPALSFVDVKPFVTAIAGSGVTANLTDGTLTIDTGGDSPTGKLFWSLTIKVAAPGDHYLSVTKGASTAELNQIITTTAVNETITFGGSVPTAMVATNVFKLRYTNSLGGGTAVDNIIQSMAFWIER